jgi:hypothetical protein
MAASLSPRSRILASYAGHCSCGCAGGRRRRRAREPWARALGGATQRGAARCGLADATAARRRGGAPPAPLLLPTRPERALDPPPWSRAPLRRPWAPDRRARWPGGVWDAAVGSACTCGAINWRRTCDPVPGRGQKARRSANLPGPSCRSASRSLSRQPRADGAGRRGRQIPRARGAVGGAGAPAGALTRGAPRRAARRPPWRARPRRRCGPARTRAAAGPPWWARGAPRSRQLAAVASPPRRRRPPAAARAQVKPGAIELHAAEPALVVRYEVGKGVHLARQRGAPARRRSRGARRRRGMLGARAAAPRAWLGDGLAARAQTVRRPAAPRCPRALQVQEVDAASQAVLSSEAASKK